LFLRYVDCWDRRALVRPCHPSNLVFDESSGQCTWPNNRAVTGLCQDSGRTSGNPERPRGPYRTNGNPGGSYRTNGNAGGSHRHYGNEVISQKNVTTITETSLESYKSTGNASRPLVAAHRSYRRFPSSALCPGDLSGPMPFPPDCTKFANCWKGRPTVQVNLV